MRYIDGQPNLALTYDDYGGAATTSDKARMNITIGIDPQHFQTAMNSGLCDKNGNDLPNPVWMVLGHELGGHGYYDYIQSESPTNQKGHALDYEKFDKNITWGGERTTSI